MIQLNNPDNDNHNQLPKEIEDELEREAESGL
jgi:hypothetical protein